MLCFATSSCLMAREMTQSCELIVYTQRTLLSTRSPLHRHFIPTDKAPLEDGGRRHAPQRRDLAPHCPPKRNFCRMLRTCWFYAKNCIFEHITDKIFPVRHLAACQCRKGVGGAGTAQRHCMIDVCVTVKHTTDNTVTLLFVMKLHINSKLHVPHPGHSFNHYSGCVSAAMSCPFVK